MSKGQALTLTGDGLLRVLQTPLRVCTPILDKKKGPDAITDEIAAVWDTGASGSVITQNVVDALKIQPTGMTQVNTASGQEVSPVYLVDFMLPNAVIIQGLRVTLGKLANFDVLIGMDVINVGDFSITNVNQKTKMTFRVPSSVEIDYVKEMEESNAMLTDESGQPLTRQQRRLREREQFKKWRTENKDA